MRAIGQSVRVASRDGSATELLTTRDGIVVRRLDAPAETTLSTVDELARGFVDTGLWPVIVGNDSPLLDFDELGRFVEDGSATWAAPADEILRLATQLDATTIFESRWADSLPIDDDADDPRASEFLDEAMPGEPVRSIPTRLVRRTGEAVIGLVPVARSADVPAVLGWGDWNACPPPHEHVVILNYWYERYGAELQAMSHDTLELAVKEPPETFADAISLARQQYAYASDIVDQGDHPTIGHLASALVNCPHWHFWWD
jgi:hypothetical protein